MDRVVDDLLQRVLTERGWVAKAGQQDGEDVYRFTHLAPGF